MEDPAILPINVDELGDWLDGGRPLSEMRERFPDFASDEDALNFLESVRRGLADIEAGRVFTTEEMMRRLESRRRARRAAA